MFSSMLPKAVMIFPDGLNRNKYQQNNKQEQNQNGEQQNKVRIPKNLLGVDLSEKLNRNTLREEKQLMFKAW